MLAGAEKVSQLLSILVIAVEAYWSPLGMSSYIRQEEKSENRPKAKI